MNTNSTMSALEAESTVQQQTVEYFMMIWPFMVSMGMGGGVLGVLYAICSYIWEQITRRMYCSV
jgi:polyferredoxin